MAKLSKANPALTGHTHGGALTTSLTPIQELRRTVAGCMLWEDQFYEGGDSIA